MINYYQELSISPDLDKDQIKKELNKLQRQWISRTNAPDLMRRQQAERMISVIEEANKILLDENKRQAYDLSLNKDTQEGYVQAHKVSEEKMRQENIQNINAEKFQYFLNEAWKNIKSKNYLEGINLAKRAVDINPNDAMAWDTLAFADREAGNIEDAVFEYKKAISIDPTNAQFYRELSYMCIENNKINEAQQYCNKALEIDNNGYENIYLKAKILAVRRDFQNAVKIFENLYKINPNDKYLIRSIADSYYNIALSFCYYQNNYYYCVNKENTLKMIEYLKKAKEFISMPEYDKKIEWGTKQLENTFDSKRWKVFILPAILIVTMNTKMMLLGAALTALFIFCMIRPRYKITARNILNQTNLFDKFYTCLAVIAELIGSFLAGFFGSK